MTEADVIAHQTKHGFKASGTAQPVPEPVKLPKPRQNATEREYGLILEAMKRRGEIVDYRFEGMTLRLADDCRFTPDFFILVSIDPLLIRFVEIKGRKIWDDAKVKFRVAKEGNAWAEWQMIQKDSSGWIRLL